MLDRIKANAKALGKELLLKLIVSIIITVVISIVSFRQVWMNDCFHIVFFTNMLSRRAYEYLKRLVK